MTDRYAVIGNPVEHSLSPAIHAEFARATGQDLDYRRILAPLDGFRAAALKFRDQGGKGLNVTLPFKHAAWNLVEAHSGFAMDAGAVNTIDFREGGSVGHNTDGTGLVRDLKENLGNPLRGRRVLLMGSGGATYGVMEPLLRELPDFVVVANRTLEKAVALVGHFEKFQKFAVRGIAARPYSALAGTRFDVVINATSAGLADVMPPLPDDIFAPDALAYEMVYGRRTLFMKFALERGAKTADGLGMLVEQAAESFFIWRGVRPETKPVIEMLRKK
ncbi:MAG: shikimate dehydrogenase [Betaproteobacteria bacterium]|nr:shikimate dehydrogenase [Betaproteobacteria bacterium]MBI2510113.1 shikimate dehydrogenase [Betaproteobacteria bacterium]